MLCSGFKVKPFRVLVDLLFALNLLPPRALLQLYCETIAFGRSEVLDLEPNESKLVFSMAAEVDVDDCCWTSSSDGLTRFW